MRSLSGLASEALRATQEQHMQADQYQFLEVVHTKFNPALAEMLYHIFVNGSGAFVSWCDMMVAIERVPGNDNSVSLKKYEKRLIGKNTGWIQMLWSQMNLMKEERGNVKAFNGKIINQFYKAAGDAILILVQRCAFVDSFRTMHIAYHIRAIVEFLGHSKQHNLDERSSVWMQRYEPFVQYLLGGFDEIYQEPYFQ
jgi:hypothetical protein